MNALATSLFTASTQKDLLTHSFCLRPRDKDLVITQVVVVLVVVIVLGFFV